MSRWHATAAGLAAFASVGCGRPTPAPVPTGKEARAEACHYTATLADGATALDVRARCTAAGIDGFRASKPETLPFLSNVRDDTGRRIDADKEGLFAVDRGTTLTYHVDLRELARDHRDFDIALHAGGAVIAPVASWILRPDPVPSQTPVSIEVHAGPGRFLTGLDRRGDSYIIDAHEIRVGTYSVFGDFDASRFELPGPGALASRASGLRSTVEVARLRRPIDAPDGAVLDWIQDSANAVATFWHGFPVPHAMVTLIPVRDRDRVVFGKVLPAGGPGVVIMLGEHAQADELHRDWVLVHELFHLGFPSFFREGKWLDEGLATYYEPIIRARAGWISEEALWLELADNVGKGMDAVTNGGLDDAQDFSGIYWGGALVALLADIETRRRSDGARGLEDGLRAVLARGGSAPHVWGLEETIAFIDEALGANTLGSLSARHAKRGSPLDLEGLLARLGIRRLSKGIELVDDAPWSMVRKSIITGKAAPRVSDSRSR